MEERIPNSKDFNEEFHRKIQRYQELRKMVDVLRKDVMYKSFIRELIEDCKTGKPNVEIIFDSSTFEEVWDDEECNYSLKDKRQFDILLVDKNRDAIAICYHYAISADWPAPVDLERFDLHHCVQLLFMPDDTYRTRPNDGDGRYYYQYRDFLLLLKNTKWFSAKVEEPKTTEENSKVDPIEHIVKKLDEDEIETFMRFYDWMKSHPRYFKYNEETKQLKILISKIEMGLIFEILHSNYLRIDKQDYNPLFVTSKGIPLEKGKTEVKHYGFVKREDIKIMRNKEREKYISFYDEMKAVCQDLGLDYHAAE